jgi:membrane-bound lytic murein transglycosylase D
LLAVATESQPAAATIAAGAVDVTATDSSASVALAEAISLPPTPEPAGRHATMTTMPSSPPIVEPTTRHHTVVRGDSPWKIAARYGIRVADLLQRNGLDPTSVLKPGNVLLIDAELVAGNVGQAPGTP